MVVTLMSRFTAVDSYENLHQMYWGNKKFIHDENGKQREDAVDIKTLENIYFVDKKKAKIKKHKTINNKVRILDNGVKAHNPNIVLDVGILSKPIRVTLGILSESVVILSKYVHLLGIVFSGELHSGCAIISHPKFSM